MKNYLVHHGVKEQKWGVKNGPPYPLDASQVPAEQRKANPKIYSDKKEDSNKKKNSNHPNYSKRRFSRKEIRNMSDQDLRKLVDRRYKEKEYYEVTRSVNEMSNPVKAAIAQGLREAGKNAIRDVSKEVFVWAGQKVIGLILSQNGKKYNKEDVGNALFGKLYKSIEKEMQQRIHRENRNKDNKDQDQNGGKGEKGGKGIIPNTLKFSPNG